MSFGPLKPKPEVADTEYCAKYIVPTSDCIFANDEGGCPHDVLDVDKETCR